MDILQTNGRTEGPIAFVEIVTAVQVGHDLIAAGRAMRTTAEVAYRYRAVLAVAGKTVTTQGIKIPATVAIAQVSTGRIGVNIGVATDRIQRRVGVTVTEGDTREKMRRDFIIGSDLHGTRGRAGIRPA